ncbi:MAG: hypothetical protein IJS61_09775 [Firmicutes bacterium]|nr:hypothetical protein [Bacillota bacterium]
MPVNLKPQQFKWLADNIDGYIFNTAVANKLKEDIKGADPYSPEAGELYDEFLRKFSNDPYIYAAGVKAEGDITASDYIYYFLENKYGVKLPVGYYLSTRQPLPSAIRYSNSAINGIEKQAYEINGKLAGSRKKGGVIFQNNKLVPVMCMSGLSLILSLFSCYYTLNVALRIGIGKNMASNVFLLMFVISCAVVAISCFSLYTYIKVYRNSDKILDISQYRQRVAQRIKNLERDILSFEDAGLQRLPITPFKPDTSVINGVDKLPPLKLEVILAAFCLVSAICGYNINKLGQWREIGYYPGAVFKNIFGVRADIYSKFKVDKNLTETGMFYTDVSKVPAELSDNSVFNANIETLFDGDTTTFWKTGAYPLTINLLQDPGKGANFIAIVLPRDPEVARIKKAVFKAGTTEFDIDIKPGQTLYYKEFDKVSVDKATLSVTQYYNEKNATQMAIADIKYGMLRK